MQQSRSLCEFSDFPIPNDIKNLFLHNTEVLIYLEKYAEQFDLKKFIHFNTNVDQILRLSSWNKTGIWKVEFTIK